MWTGKSTVFPLNPASLSLEHKETETSGLLSPQEKLSAVQPAHCCNSTTEMAISNLYQLLKCQSLVFFQPFW